MTAELVLLRAVQLGISLSDLDLLPIGMLMDLYTESLNDEQTFARVATQEDFDQF